MRKTTNKKRLSAAVLAMAMAAAMPMTALAVTAPTPGQGADTHFDKNKGETTVNVEGMTDTEIDKNLAAKVPITVKLAVMGGGDVMGPGNYVVQNTSQDKKIKVKTIQAQAVGTGYVVSGTATAQQVDLSDITLNPTWNNVAGDSIKLETAAPTAGMTPNATQWTLEKVKGTDAARTKVEIRFGGNIDDVKKLSAAATAAGGETAFKLIYTIEKVN